MTMLSGLVAILDADGQPTGEVRDLGPKPVQVKPGKVAPLEDARPALAEDEVFGAATVEVVGGKAVRTYSVQKVAPEVSLEERVAVLEAKIAELAGAKLARG